MPIIVISARQGQNDKVLALRGGADDFISKPFDIYDVEARIETVIRRSTRPSAPKVGINLGELTISKEFGCSFKGVSLHLTPNEYLILHYLICNQGSSVTLDALALEVWGEPVDSVTRLRCKKLIERLNRRLNTLEGLPRIIKALDLKKGYLLRGS